MEVEKNYKVQELLVVDCRLIINWNLNYVLNRLFNNTFNIWAESIFFTVQTFVNLFNSILVGNLIKFAFKLIN